ncbi:hypothetical protein DITRI_Ditri01bG0088700 [Diplodiscus trichospermus]
MPNVRFFEISEIPNPTVKVEFFSLYVLPSSFSLSSYSVSVVYFIFCIIITAMALSRFLSLITMALLFCSVIAQSPTPSPVSSPKKSPSSSPTPVSSPPTVSTSSPSKTPSATAPSPVTVESPTSSSPSPVNSPSSISGTPTEAPGPAENSAVLNLNGFGAAGSFAIGLLTAVMVL